MTTQSLLKNTTINRRYRHITAITIVVTCCPHLVLTALCPFCSGQLTYRKTITAYNLSKQHKKHTHWLLMWQQPETEMLEMREMPMSRCRFVTASCSRSTQVSETTAVTEQTPTCTATAHNTPTVN